MGLVFLFFVQPIRVIHYVLTMGRECRYFSIAVNMLVQPGPTKIQNNPLGNCSVI